MGFRRGTQGVGEGWAEVYVCGLVRDGWMDGWMVTRWIQDKERFDRCHFMKEEDKVGMGVGAYLFCRK